MYALTNEQRGEIIRSHLAKKYPYYITKGSLKEYFIDLILEMTVFLLKIT